MCGLTLDQGLLLLNQERFKEVHGQAIKMIERDLRDPLPFFFLGIIAAEHGNYRKAPELFAKAVELGPDVAHFHVYQAKNLSTMGQQNAAKCCADKAAMLDIDDPGLADTIGVVYSRAGFHEEAIPFFKQSVSLDPGQANYHYNLAASAQFIGDFEAAKTAYLATLELDDDHFRAWSSLISLEKQTEDSNHLARLTTLFEQAEGNAEARLHLGHAIAKTLEDIGRHGESLDWLLKAKQAKRDQLRYDLKSGRALFAAAKQTCRAEGGKQEHAQQDTATPNSGADHAPIFVFGLPRTGTTLVDRILSSHPDAISAGELNILAELVKTRTGTLSNHVMDAETFRQAAVTDLHGIGAAYMESAAERVAGGGRIIDKMPLNFFYAGIINRVLPDARIIALRRGAMDSCLSNFRQLFSTRYSYYNYSFDLEDTGEFYRMFDDLMGHWRQALPADRFMEVRYEDIVFDQEAQTRRMLDFCGLGWDEACMRFHENSAPVSTASSVQVRQPLYSGSIGRWKKYDDGLESLKQVLGNLAD